MARLRLFLGEQQLFGANLEEGAEADIPGALRHIADSIETLIENIKEGTIGDNIEFEFDDSQEGE